MPGSGDGGFIKDAIFYYEIEDTCIINYSKPNWFELPPGIYSMKHYCSLAEFENPARRVWREDLDGKVQLIKNTKLSSDKMEDFMWIKLSAKHLNYT